MSAPPSDTKYLPSFEENFDEGRAQQFKIQKLIREVHTSMIVQVQAVTPITASVGVVTVIPMVEDTTTGGVVIAQSPCYDLPYFRLQGGTSAVIIDPAIGDIGLAVFAERDITGVVQMLQPGPPPTPRSHSSADGLYLGGFLNAAPVQWVHFLAGGAGIDIKTPGALTLEGQTVNISAGTTMVINAPGGLTINAPVTFTESVSGTASATGSVQFAAPVTAPDFIAPNAKLNTHQHAVSGSSTVGNPHN